MGKVVDLGFCPRCKSDLEGMMTRIVRGVKFCYLCSFDFTDVPNDPELDQWVRWAKEYAKNMM